MSDACYSPEASRHLLQHEQDRREDDEQPEERQPIVLAGLSVERKAPSLVVGNHDENAGAHHCEQHPKPRETRLHSDRILRAESSERTVDVTEMRAIQDSPRLGRPREDGVRDVVTQ